MLAREHSEVVGWEKEATLETIIGNDKRQMNVAMLKTAGQAQPAILDKMYFYTWMPDLILTQKLSRADAQSPSALPRHARFQCGRL